MGIRLAFELACESGREDWLLYLTRHPRRQRIRSLFRSYLDRRIDHAPHEQDAIGAVLSDEAKERMVCTEDDWLRPLSGPTRPVQP